MGDGQDPGQEGSKIMAGCPFSKLNFSRKKSSVYFRERAEKDQSFYSLGKSSSKLLRSASSKGITAQQNFIQSEMVSEGKNISAPFLYAVFFPRIGRTPSGTGRIEGNNAEFSAQSFFLLTERFGSKSRGRDKEKRGAVSCFFIIKKILSRLKKWHNTAPSGVKVVIGQFFFIYSPITPPETRISYFKSVVYNENK
jgi:hypothetical protein